jgi:serine/threonine-protein kinase RsbT
VNQTIAAKDEVVAVRNEADIYTAIGIGRTMADRLGFEYADRTRVETIIAELARNVLQHGEGGQVMLQCIARSGSADKAYCGLEIIVEDHGPGIVDLASVLAGGHSRVGGLGVGIPAVCRLADEFTIDSMPGHGTRVCARKWARVADPASDR